MTRSGSPRRLHRPHAFPFLFALVTVTALLAANRGEGVRPADVLLPTILAIASAFIGWGIGCLTSRDRTNQNLIALSFVVVSLAGGYPSSWVTRVLPLGSGGGSILLLGLTATALLLTIVACRNTILPRPAPQFLNVMGAAMLVFGLPGLLDLFERRPALLPEPVPLQVEDEYGRPDIFLVTLDAYTGSTSLASNYGFDNGPFLDSLRARGFRIPRGATANYPNTFLSVGSMLNRRYVDDPAMASGPDSRDRSPAYRALEFNQTISDLKSLGYEFYYVGSSYPPMARNRNAEEVAASRMASEFETVWMSGTLVLPLAAVSCMTRDCRARAVFSAEDASGTERRVEDFLRTVSRPSPKFAYLHLLLPHRPFRFGRDCAHRTPVWNVASDNSETGLRALYLGQLMCANTMVLRLVDSIRAAAGDSAVIILQADHGFGRFGPLGPQTLAASEADQVLERFDVFAAYAGPAEIADSLASVGTPVNLFRTLFRVLWEADEPPLPDRHYWADAARPMDLFEIDLDSIRVGR